jgi:hypothetical protein
MNFNLSEGCRGNGLRGRERFDERDEFEKIGKFSNFTFSISQTFFGG